MYSHDAFSWGSSQNLTFVSAAGAAASTAGLNAQTKYVRLCAIGVPTATGGARYVVDKNPIATSASVFLPTGTIEVIRIANGERISVLSNDSTGGTLNIVEALT